MADQRTAPLNAIETTYAGHLFRSRLEARWAVFFDAFGVEWEYEPQGYVVGCWRERPYLPDFHLPAIDLWAEVKGSDRAVDWSLLGDAVDGFGQHLPMDEPGSHRRYGGGSSNGAALVVLGNIPPPAPSLSETWGHPLVVNQKGAMVDLCAWAENKGTASISRFRQQLGVYDSTSGDRDFSWMAGAPESVHGRGWWHDATGRYSVSRVHAAYTKARKARFEHGANGR